MIISIPPMYCLIYAPIRAYRPDVFGETSREAAADHTSPYAFPKEKPRFGMRHYPFAIAQ